jgi:hypothetical protein
MTFTRSIAQLASAGGSLPIKVSPADTTPADLLAKLAAGTGMTLNLLNPGANEQVELAAGGGALPYTPAIVTGGTHAATPNAINLVLYNGVTLTLPAYPNEGDRLAVMSSYPVTMDGTPNNVYDPFVQNQGVSITCGFNGILWYSEWQYTLEIGYPFWLPTSRGCLGASSDVSFVPSCTSILNVASTTSFNTRWVRIGNVVTVSGQVTVTPSGASTQTQLSISFPIASNISLPEQCSGSAVAFDVNSVSANIYGDVANQYAVMNFYPYSTNPIVFGFSFSYQVV